MGLTNTSTGKNTVDRCFTPRKEDSAHKVIALAGNPNVGKTTVFNGLTGMNQHTGNWPGKTVSTAYGYCKTESNSYLFIDLPGTYSLLAHSAEEEVARDFICFEAPDAVVVVCDATCLHRNMNLVLQATEICSHVLVCLNMMDEAERKHIEIDVDLLSKRLGVPVVPISARNPETLEKLMDSLDHLASSIDNRRLTSGGSVKYPAAVEKSISLISETIKNVAPPKANIRWLSLRLLEADPLFFQKLVDFIDCKYPPEEMQKAILQAGEILKSYDISPDKLQDLIVSSITDCADKICDGAVRYIQSETLNSDRKIDRILTGKTTGYPIMMALLAAVLWLTISGANYPSQLLSQLFGKIESLLTDLFVSRNAPQWLYGVLVQGMYKVLTWVVSVMLPPMAIFFPLFTLLEDLGYLPRIAYNLDKPFKKCCACGKQALTMCMGFGCNAAGVVGCRIIDSPRERLLAILTNNFVPCNGRFPTLITLITIFFIGTSGGFITTGLSALMLTVLILLGIAATFVVTNILSKTILKGVPSSFTLELPPYRKPQIGKVIIRSIFDRTLFVLGRAAAIAAPAGMIIWCAANIFVDCNGEQTSLLNCASDFLDPMGKLMGLDGVILIAFILGFPANEIVIPIVIMAYMAQGSLVELEDLSQLKLLFTENGWTQTTAISTMMFSLFHWPCSTTLLTIRKETESWKWTGLAALIPTVMGVMLCLFVNGFSKWLALLI